MGKFERRDLCGTRSDADGLESQEQKSRPKEIDELGGEEKRAERGLPGCWLRGKPYSKVSYEQFFLNLSEMSDRIWITPSTTPFYGIPRTRLATIATARQAPM